MTLHRSEPIPQPLQQHGGKPKRLPEPAPATPLEAAIESLKALDKPGAFTTSPAFDPKILKAS